MWHLDYSLEARKQLKKLDRDVAKRILDYLDEVAASDIPRSRGKALTHDKKGLWRYRIGDYRVLAEIRDKELVIIALEVGHRRNIYE